jgi:hypothetical protein
LCLGGFAVLNAANFGIIFSVKAVLVASEKLPVIVVNSSYVNARGFGGSATACACASAATACATAAGAATFAFTGTALDFKVVEGSLEKDEAGFVGDEDGLDAASGGLYTGNFTGEGAL